MRALVTGNRGFIGTQLTALLDDLGHEWMGLDAEDGSDLVMIRRHKGWDKEIADFQPQVVFHLAAKHYVPWCRENPVETMLVNERGTANLIISLARNDKENLQAFILASSAAVYGFGPRPFNEKDPSNPIDVYGRSKVMAEHYVHRFTSSNKLIGVAARLSNVIGVGDSHPHLLPKIMSGERPQLGNLWPKRDYIYVGNVVMAMGLMPSMLTNGFHKINVSTGIPTTPLQLLEACNVVDYDWQPGRADDGDLVLDPRKMQRVLGYKASTTIQEVVKEWAS